MNPNIISELVDIPHTDSKIENSQSLINLLKKDEISQRKGEQLEHLNMLDIENTCRNGTFEDGRELNKNKMITSEDEISMISSRIDINRKGINSSILDVMNSNRKNKLESSRILDSIKKNNEHKIIIVNERKQKGGFE